MNVSPGSDRSRVWLVLAGFGGLVASIVILYPGWLSYDSSYQYWQVRTGEFSNLSPVTMMALWKVIHALGGTPAAMLVVHLAAYWVGVMLLASVLGRGATARVAFIVGVGFLPPSFVVLGHLWTDASLIAAMTLALGLTVAAGRRRWLLGAAVPAIIYAGAVRHNSLLAIVPLAWLWARRWLDPVPARGDRSWPTTASVPRTLAIAAVLLVASLGTARALDATLVRERVSTWAIGALWDLAGISVRTGTVTIPEFARTPGLTIDTLRAKYRTYAGVPLFDGPGGVRHGLGTDVFDADELARLRSAWISAMADHPGAYLAHRLAVSRQLFGSYADAPEGLFFVPTVVPYRDNPPAPAALTPVREQMVAVIRHAKGWPVFIPAVYVAAATLASIVAWRRRRTRAGELALASAASGLLLVLPLTVFAPSAELRYCGWLFVSSVISVVALICRPGRAVP